MHKDCLGFEVSAENNTFGGLDDKQCPALTAYIAAASVSSSRSTASGSGRTGALDQNKTVGTGGMVEAVRSGGRDGLIGRSGKGLVDKGMIYEWAWA